jgi:hypothetical protein
MLTLIELLAAEHRRIRALFDAFETLRSREAALRLGDALVLHACVESAYLHPLVRSALAAGAGEVFASESEDDHEKVKSFVAEADDTTGPALDELFEDLRVDVEVHMRWEEEDLFPLLREVVNDALGRDVARLADAYMRVRLPVG